MAKVFKSKQVTRSWTGENFYGFQRIKPLRNGGKVMMVPEDAPLIFQPKNQIDGFAWAEVDENELNKRLVGELVLAGHFYMENPDLLDVEDGKLIGEWVPKTAKSEAEEGEVLANLTELRITYKELLGKEVAVNKKNDAEWMQAKIDEKLKED